MEIRKLNKQALRAFIDSAEFERMPNIPISRHRAVSHMGNPRADDSDTLLVMLYIEGRMAAYMGILPDRIRYKGRMEKCGWISCIWLDPGRRGQGIAAKLLQASIDAWDTKLLGTEFTAPAKRLYDRSGNFRDLAELNGVRLYIRSDLRYLMPPKHRVFDKGKFLLNAADGIFNAWFDLRFRFAGKPPEGMSLEYIDHIDGEAAEFIEARQDRQLFRRSADELNWILENPWILPEEQDDGFSDRYYFTAVDRSFGFIPLKVRNTDGRLLAVMVFAKRNERLKLPYCYYDGPAGRVAEVIHHHIVKWRVSLFTVFHREIANYLYDNPTPALAKKRFKRNYIVAKAFAADGLEKDFIIQDGDADCSFT